TADCSGDPLATDTENLTKNQDGSYSASSTPYTTDTVTTYHWISEDHTTELHKPYDVACRHVLENSTVNKAQPSIVTSADTNVTVAAPISDSAPVSPGYDPPSLHDALPI